jgi:hypothetical protein
MSDHLKKGAQTGTGRSGGTTHPSSGQGENDTGADFGTSERATRGTNRDADQSGTSINEGHGHPREERSS